MKTLNLILTENCLKYKGHTKCEECHYWDDCKGKNVNALILSAVKDFLEQWKSDPDGILTVDEVGQIQLDFLDEIERMLPREREN